MGVVAGIVSKLEEEGERRGGSKSEVRVASMNGTR